MVFSHPPPPHLPQMTAGHDAHLLYLCLYSQACVGGDLEVARQWYTSIPAPRMWKKEDENIQSHLWLHTSWATEYV